MAIKRVIFHAGILKTGSKSLQKSLFHNSEVLERNGFRYLREWGACHENVIIGLLGEWECFRFFIDGRFGRYSREESIRIRNDYIEKMLEVISNTPCETLIISAESMLSFANNLSKFITEYLKKMEIKIIAYIRNPLTHPISLYQQYMTNPWDYLYNIFKDARQLFDYRIPTSFYNLTNYHLSFFKFEDAIQDEDGLAGHFLKTIGLPGQEVKNINVFRSNESRSCEAIEFLSFAEERVPTFILDNSGCSKNNPIIKDTRPLKKIRGPKFDLSYQNKVELWEQMQDTVIKIRDTIGIDYTDYTVPQSPDIITYSPETIEDFLEAFPKINLTLQKLFLEFFRKKHYETGLDKFRKLYEDGSMPQKMYQLGLQVEDLQEKLTVLQTENAELQSKQAALQIENADLQTVLQAENIELKVKLATLQEEKDSLQNTCLAFLNSNSWKFTKPLRKIMDTLRGRG
jgi:hypothetical protein